MCDYCDMISATVVGKGILLYLNTTEISEYFVK